MTPDAMLGTQQIKTRSELAGQLLARVERLAPRLGDISLAAEVQLLKRELARGHAVLTVRLEDNNYLSVVTLVEALLASLTWKDYTPQILDALRRAFTAGTPEFDFCPFLGSDRKVLGDKNLQPTPSCDFCQQARQCNVLR